MPGDFPWKDSLNGIEVNHEAKEVRVYTGSVYLTDLLAFAEQESIPLHRIEIHCGGDPFDPTVIGWG